MSSDDDSGFDKEAEREKLREKYEQDSRDRENTQRMSELLLQGATMTGKHCDNCGDPIFRYDGQEFCPTCQYEAEANAEAAETASQPDQQTAEQANQPTAGQTDQQTADQSATDQPATDQSSADRATADRQDADDEPRVEINDVRVADRHADASDLRQPPSRTDSEGRSSDSRRRGRDAHDHAHRRNASDSRTSSRSTDRTPTDREPTDRGPADRGPAERTSDAGDLATAREALVRKLSDLAGRAEETDDVARARELLAATREAAEALEALDRANR